MVMGKGGVGIVRGAKVLSDACTRPIAQPRVTFSREQALKRPTFGTTMPRLVTALVYFET
jgi:hypothetical protein